MDKLNNNQNIEHPKINKLKLILNSIKVKLMPKVKLSYLKGNHCKILILSEDMAILTLYKILNNLEIKFKHVTYSNVSKYLNYNCIIMSYQDFKMDEFKYKNFIIIEYARQNTTKTIKVKNCIRHIIFKTIEANVNSQQQQQNVNNKINKEVECPIVITSRKSSMVNSERNLLNSILWLEREYQCHIIERDLLYCDMTFPGCSAIIISNTNEIELNVI